MAAVCIQRNFPSNQCNGLKSDLELSDSGLRLAWLLDVLWKNCDEFRAAVGNGSVHEVTSRDISEGKGFMSKVYKTVLCFTKAPSDTFTVMMKVPSIAALDKFTELSVKDGKETTLDSSSLLDVYDSHNIECNMYELLRGTGALPLPTVWYTRHASKDTIGVILMPDLSVDNVCPGWTHSLTVQQIKNTNEHLAKFHAHLLCMSKDETALWEGVVSKKPFWIEEFDKFLLDTLNNIEEYGTDSFKSLLRQVKPMMTPAFFRYALVDRPQEIGLPLILQHGDTGAHNMFFQKNPDGCAASETSAFIDWQIAFKGNQFFDTARAVYGFADAEVRREVEETIIDDYFKVLTSEMTKRGRSLNFGLDALREGYALAAVHQSCCAVILPGIFDVKKDEFASEVFEAWRHKFLLRAKLALTDAIKMLKKYAPQYLAEGQ